MKEVWRDAVGHEGYYQVSNLGRVRSVDRRIRSGPREHSTRIRKGRILRLTSDSGGYLHLTLSKECRPTSRTVHRLVAIAFLGLRVGHEVNHKNGNKHDNRLSNLEWVTPAENQRHAIKIGLKTAKKGLKAKIQENLRKKIMKFKGKMSANKVRKICGVAHSTVQAIWSGTPARKLTEVRKKKRV